MVASFMEKSVTKSYVRLPGSGSDKKATASFCDLARASILAASISVPQNIGMQRFVSAKLASAAQNKRPRTEDDTVVPTAFSKRPRLETTVQNAVRTTSEVKFQPVTVTAAPVIPSPQGIANNIPPTTNTVRIVPLSKLQNPVASSQVVTSNIPTISTAPCQNSSQVYVISNAGPDVKKLQEENAHLKAENASLHKQVSLFKQLMRNPERLQSVIERLNVKQN